MLNRTLRGIAGTVVLISLALAVFLDMQYFLYLTAFVGLNLLQSSFTNWCPMMTFLRLAGVSEEGCPIEKATSTVNLEKN